MYFITRHLSISFLPLPAESAWFFICREVVVVIVDAATSRAGATALIEQSGEAVEGGGLRRSS